MKKTYILALLFILPLCINAQFVINAGGNWTDPASWQGGVPAATVGDDVTMQNNLGITVQAGDNISAGNLMTGSNNTLSVQGAGTLQLGDASNARTFTAGTNMGITVQNNGTIIIWGDVSVTNSLSITIFGPTGKIIIKGNVLMADNAVLSVSGDLEVDGNFTGGMNTTVLVGVGGSINVNGTLTVGAGSFYHASCSPCGTFRAHQCGSDPDSQAFCASGLPVELLYFHGEADLASVVLNWATASELNFDYFLVEKSADGKNFSEMTKVTGNGTSRETHLYSAADEKPVSGNTYYRLTEVDLDRTVHILRTVAVDFTGVRRVNIFPNPVIGGQVSFELNFVPESKVQVSIVDLRGVTLTSFELDQQSVTLPVQLTSGIYVVALHGQGFRSVSKMVVK